MAEPFLSVVIPAFNEAGRIGLTLQQVVGYLGSQRWEWEVVVSDDGSTDATAQVVSAFARQETRVRLLPLSHGGKGWAVRHGMLESVGQWRFLCDADLSMPIRHLERFLTPSLDVYDIAIGSREAPGARRIGEPWVRHLGGRLFNLAVRVLAVPGVSDTQCGFKLLRGSAAHRLFRLQRLNGFSFDAEVLFLARRLGMRIVEVPIDWYYRKESKVRLLRDAPAMVRDLAAVRWRYRWGRRPQESFSEEAERQEEEPGRPRTQLHDRPPPL